MLADVNQSPNYTQLYVHHIPQNVITTKTE